MVKPFVKWAGGKTQLLKEIKKYLPNKIDVYYEPFLGGGALLFYILKNYNPKKVVVSDINEELINCYKIIKTKPEELITILKGFKINHSVNYYYLVRGLETSTTKKLGLTLSDCKPKMTDVEKAARFIYLNKTCFNGLYRVNKENKFNVPIGRYKNPEIFNEKNILMISKQLQNVELKVMSFEEVLIYTKSKDFIYFDPPYDQINENSFVSYTDNEFTRKDQIKLRNIFEALDKKGCLILESNSSTDFIREQYKKYNIKEIYAKRMINCDGSKRNNIKELLIKNY